MALSYRRCESEPGSFGAAPDTSTLCEPFQAREGDLMPRTRVGRFLGRFGLLLVTVFILLLTQQGHATTTNNLNFFKN